MTTAAQNGFPPTVITAPSTVTMQNGDQGAVAGGSPVKVKPVTVHTAPTGLAIASSDPYTWTNCPAPERPLPRYPKGPFSWVDFLMQFRWAGIIPVVLPLSYCWAKFHLFSAWFKAKMRGKASIDKHIQRIKRIQDHLKNRDPETDGLICTARPSYWSVTQRRLDYKKSKRFEVDLSDLADIIDIDEEAMTVYCEPYVSIGQLTHILLPRNVCVPVVPEYDDLTVGGLIAGYGVEGSSHKHGLFADTVVSVEVLLADGSLCVATKDNEYKDLYYAIQWTQGTIGLLVGATIRIQRVKPYVKVTYIPVFGDFNHISEKWRHIVAPTHREWHEFQEGLVYSSNSAVLMTGDFVDKEEAKKCGPINNMGRWYKPWFYKYAESMLKKDGPYVEYVPTRDYFHRHTRALYWEMELLLPFGNNPIFRFFLGWLMPPRVSFLKLTTIGDSMWDYYNNKLVAQDVLVPMRKTAECLEKSHDLFDIYPIWLNAHRIFKTRCGHMIDCEQDYDKPALEQGDTEDAQMYTDVGIWSTPKPVARGEVYCARDTQADLEQWLIQNHGYQALYAVTEMTEDDFWKMFDKTLYQEARKKYNAEGAFMDVYYKIHRRGAKRASVLEKEKANGTANGTKTNSHTNGNAPVSDKKSQ